MLTAVGNDHYGEEILDVYRKEGVAPEFVKMNPQKADELSFCADLQSRADDPHQAPGLRICGSAGAGQAGPTGSIFLPSASIRCRSIISWRNISSGIPDVRMGFNPGTFQLRFGADKLKDIYKHTHVLFVNREEAELVVKKKEGTDIRVLFEGAAPAWARRSS